MKLFMNKKINGYMIWFLHFSFVRFKSLKNHIGSEREGSPGADENSGPIGNGKVSPPPFIPPGKQEQ